MLDVGELTRTEIINLDPTLRRPSRGHDADLHLLDTTMLFAPRSGGVKRYLLAKRAWLARARPDLRHTLVTPGRFEPRQGGIFRAGAGLQIRQNDDDFRAPADDREGPATT